MSKKKREGARMDFLMEITALEEKSGVLEVKGRLVPDPRRYEWRVVDGKRCLYDKFDNVFIPESELARAAEKAKGIPIYCQQPRIADAESYVMSRRPYIIKRIRGFEETPTFQDKSEAFLQSLATDKLNFVILSLDIVGSTRLAVGIEPKMYARLISTILFELSEIVPKFHGHVLKYLGDGFIAYFPEPSFISMNDLAVDCSVTLRLFVYRILNPTLAGLGFPRIGVRIGLDAGEAYVKTIGSPETKQHKDIIGAVVSLAAKIQQKAEQGGIYFGQTVERNLYITWRQLCQEVDLGKDWTYKDRNGNPYKVYKLSIRKPA